MEIEVIRLMIERAMVDGILSREESEAIKAAIYADKKVTREEAEIFRLLQQKVWECEIIIEDLE
jgi:hypothetical protein